VLIAGLIAGGIIVILVSIAWIFWPTWENTHRPMILAMQAEAEDLSRHGRPKEAYYKYKELIEFVGNRRLSDPTITESITSAKAAMQRSYALAAPVIAKEEAEQRARIAEQQRQEQLRLAEQRRQEQLRIDRELTEAEKRRQEELARREREREQQRLAREKADAARRLARIRSSPQFAELKRQASEIEHSLSISLIGEDSAYRSISVRSQAAGDLLAVYVKLQGMVYDQDVAAEVDSTMHLAEVEMIGEDSAIRAIYKHDKVFFDLLGIWCRVLDKSQPGLASSYASEASSVRLRLAGDDSAPRAISGYTGVSMNVLRDIISDSGHRQDADRIVSSVSLDNSTENSAWRASWRNSEAVMKLLLLRVSESNARRAEEISRSATVANIGEDSALRAQSEFEKGTADALAALISAE
jgi:hypothetical protein